MADDLDALTAKLRSDPSDPLTVQALADWIEERGGEGLTLRALAVDGPTVLVFGYPHGFTAQERPGLEEVGNKIARFLSQASGGVPILPVYVPAALTIRQIRAAAGKGGDS